MSGAAGGVDDDIATRVFKCNVCGLAKYSEYKINHHMSYRVNSSETSHVEYVRRETMLLRRRRQILNELADGEVGLSDRWLCDYKNERCCWNATASTPCRSCRRNTRRVGEGEMNSRNFVWSSTLWTKTPMLCCSDSASFVTSSSSQSWSSTIDSLISSFVTKLRLCGFEYNVRFMCKQNFRFDNVNYTFELSFVGSGNY